MIDLVEGGAQSVGRGQQRAAEREIGVLVGNDRIAAGAAVKRAAPV